MIKRNKRYNPLKRVNTISAREDVLMRSLFQDVGIVCNLLDMTKSSLVAAHTIPKQRKSTIMQHLFEHKQDWAVYCAVCIKEPNGKHNLQTIDLGVSAPAKFEDIAGRVESAHKEFLYSFIKRIHLVTGYGFICYPSSNERTDDELLTAFQEAGCFDGSYRGSINAENHVEFLPQEVANV